MAGENCQYCDIDATPLCLDFRFLSVINCGCINHYTVDSWQAQNTKYRLQQLPNHCGWQKRWGDGVRERKWENADCTGSLLQTKYIDEYMSVEKVANDRLDVIWMAYGGDRNWCLFKAYNAIPAKCAMVCERVHFNPSTLRVGYDATTKKE